MNLSLAVEYRPKDWDSVVEQDSVVKVLRKQVELESFRNCYLFYGASGSGKTTVARIFAKAINKNVGNPIEIDAASNSGVDNVREIIAKAQERSIESKYKIYILDECHMLSNAAWNALLKLIEEPPMYTIFIFCTTDVQKVPLTIRNRTQVYNFTRISQQGIRERLQEICRKEQFTNYTETADYISKISNGGMRDALTYLDKCASYSTDLNIDTTLEILGNYSFKSFFKLMNDLLDGNQGDVLNTIQNYYSSGKDLKLFVDQFLAFCIDVIKYCIFKDVALIKIPGSMVEDLNNIINFENPQNYYNYVIDKLLELKNMLKNDTDPKSTIEVVLSRITACV